MKNFLSLFAFVIVGLFHVQLLASPADLLASTSSYQSRQDKATPQSVLNWLKDGNSRFSAGSSNHGGFVIDARPRATEAALGQRPLAAILSCIDSRTTPELVFDTSVGDLFTARVGANVINDDILGSLEIAAESGIKVLVVLGHTDCGGVKAACNGLKLGHMTQLLERIKPAIDKANSNLDKHPDLSTSVGERKSTNRRYVAEVSHMNALQSINQIWKRSQILRDKVKHGEIILISAIYDVDTGNVTFDQPMLRH
jgi:carbonic anhydrase